MRVIWQGRYFTAYTYGPHTFLYSFRKLQHTLNADQAASARAAYEREAARHGKAAS
jgi:hypothetical protein